MEKIFRNGRKERGEVRIGIGKMEGRKDYVIIQQINQPTLWLRLAQQIRKSANGKMVFYFELTLC
jgi:hypothetical protein